MGQPPTSVSYEIRVRGLLGETMLGAFPGMQARAYGMETVLAGALPDQAALYGVLGQIEALGLELLELRRMPPPIEGKADHHDNRTGAAVHDAAAEQARD
jgi:hypothetical protein